MVFLVRIFLKLTSLRGQRAILGFALCGLALPTWFAYDFWGRAAMSMFCAIGGVVALGLAVSNPPLEDRREVATGATLMAVFGCRFVVFVVDDIREVGEPLWYPSTQWQLYRSSSPLWIHFTMVMIGAVLLRRWAAARYGEEEGA